ncbi:MAG: hypothetical protein F4X60_14265 [Gemmatimonadetes bacterium]|nr:hypothetical protein [Gemmatimonadota bacterium]
MRRDHRRGRGSRHGRAAGRNQATKRKNVLGGVIGLLALLTLIALFVRGQRGSRAFDAANCPEDGGYAAQIAVLVDPSDTLTTVQEGSGAPRVLETIENGAPATAEIRIYTVGQAGRGNTRAVFRVCKPVHPDDVGSFTGNPALAERRYEEDFLAPLEQALTSLLSVEGDSISPIVEGIQVAAVSAFQPRDADIPRQLLIVSDMIQNSRNLSFYREAVEFGPLSRNPDYGTLRVDLSGVEVSVFLLARRGGAGRIQGGTLRGFWEDYFLDQGASPLARPRWIMVEG